MSSQSTGKILARNSLTNLARYLVNFAVAFYLTPTIIRAVGDAQYGLWALTFSLVGYAGLLDMGVQLATIKLVAQYNAQKDTERLSGLCSTVLCFFLFVGVLASCFCWFVLPVIMPSFVTDASVLTLSGHFLRIIGLDVLFVFLANVFIGVGLGLQQYHLRGLLDMVLALVKLAATIWILHLGHGLIGLAWVKLALDVLTTLIMFWVCLRTVPGLRFHPALLSKASLRAVFSFGGKLFVSSTMTRINQSTVPVIISASLGTVSLAIYSVGTGLSSYFKEIVYALTASFMPIFSEMNALNNHDEARTLYLKYSRLLLMLILPGYSFLLICGPAFLDAWVGQLYAREGAWVMRLLAAAALFEGLQPLAGRFIVGGGKLGRYVALSTAANLVALASCAALTPWLGLKGAGAGIAAVSACSATGVFFIIRSDYGVEWARYAGVLARACPPALIFSVLLILLQADALGQGFGGLAARASAALVPAFVIAPFCLTMEERRRVFEHISRKALPGKPLSTPSEDAKP